MERFAARYALPIESGPSDARLQGQGFEAQALEELKRQLGGGS